MPGPECERHCVAACDCRCVARAAGQTGRRQRSSAATSSAICAVLSAAPLRRLSPHHEEVERRSGSRGPGGSGRRRSGRCRPRPPASGTPRPPGRRGPRRSAPPPALARASADRTSLANVAWTASEWVGHDRDPHAGRRDRQVGDAEDLAGLVADLQLLRRPAVVAHRARPRHDVERQRRGERRRPSPTALRTSPATWPRLRSPPTASISS